MRQTRPAKPGNPVEVPERTGPHKAIPKTAIYGKNNEAILAERRQTVASFYLQGKSQVEIALKLGVSQPTIGSDLKHIREEWVAQGIKNFDEAKAKELAGLDLAETELWDSWFKSKETAETKIIRIRKAPDVPNKFKGSTEGPKSAAQRVLQEGAEKLRIIEKNIELTRRGQCGNPTFMAQIIQIKEMRLKIIGAFKDDNKGNINIFNIDWDRMAGRPEDTEDPIEKKIAEAKMLSAHEEE